MEVRDICEHLLKENSRANREAVQILKKAIPEKVLTVDDYDGNDDDGRPIIIDYHFCPNCHTGYLSKAWLYCPHCGQRLTWDD